MRAESGSESSLLAARGKHDYANPGACFLLVISFLFFACSREPENTDVPVAGDMMTLAGKVLDENGPVEGAIVRLKTTDRYTISGKEGLFSLQFVDDGTPCLLTAWGEGCYITGRSECQPGDTTIELYLKHFSPEDNPDYRWISAYASAGSPDNCENCHSSASEPGYLPFDEWKGDAHALSAENIRFLTMYAGTDILGNKSPPTVFVSHPEYGSIPLLPDPDQPYFGPGYQLDFPATAGNCASCHTPMAAINHPYGTNPALIEGVHKEGINCDFCHKILDVKLDQETGAPGENRPGVLSFEFRRPFDGHQFFAGPFDDVYPGEDTYAPVQRESQYCAPCHFGSFWGVQIYNSYGEWLESEYSEGIDKLTCQDCHMPSGLTDHFARLDKEGSIRNSGTIGSHRMLGTGDEEFMRNSVTLDARVSSDENRLAVITEITNDKTGHHIPTDSPLRHLILVVETRDEQGNMLEQTTGTTLPEWCGEGDPAEGYFAGMPGEVYAKILKEYWTEKEPTGSYWMQTRVVRDNRIRAMETAISEFRFSIRQSARVNVSVKLIYRRAFIELSDQKGWENKDILLAGKSFTLQFN